MGNKKKIDTIDPNAFSDTIKAQDDTDDNGIIPDREEYYTLDLNRSDKNDMSGGLDIAEAHGDDIDVTKSSSYYDGDVVTGEDETEDTDLGGSVPRKEIVDQDSTSTEAGEPGHPGIDDDTG